MTDVRPLPSGATVDVVVPELASAFIAPAVVEASGVVPVLEASVVASTGRPHDGTVAQALAAILAYTVCHNRELPIRRVLGWVATTAGLWEALDLPDQWSMWSLYRMYRAICWATTRDDDPKRISATVKRRTGEIRKRPLRLPAFCGLTLTQVMSRLVNACVPESVPSSKRVALDTTDLEAYGRRRAWGNEDKHDGNYPFTGPDGRPIKSTDHDAREGYSTPGNNERESEDKEGKKHGHRYVGYAITAIVDAAPGDDDKVIPVVRDLAAHPGGVDPVIPARQLADEHRLNVNPIGEMLIDRGFSNTKAQRLKLPLKRDGVDTVFTPMPYQLTTHPCRHEHTHLVNGKVVTDAMPDKYNHLTWYTRGMPADERKKLEAQYDRMDRYTFVEYRKDKNPLVEHLMGPARALKIRCVNYPKSMLLPADDKHPTTDCTLGEPCGCALFVTLDSRDEDYPRDRQRYTPGARKHRRAYGQRNLVEGVFGIGKSTYGHFERGVFQVFGLEQTGLLTALYWGGVNIRMCWAKGICHDAVPEELRPPVPQPPPKEVKPRPPKDKIRAAAEAKIAA